MKYSDIYTSIEDARRELKKRQEDKDLCSKIESKLGTLMWSDFKDKPRGVLWRFVLSPDNGFTYFFQRAKYVGTDPLVFEYINDMFVSLNEEKKGLGRLRLISEQGKLVTADIIDFHKNQKKPFSEVLTKSGEKLTDFHKNLVAKSGYNVELRDISSWCHSLGKPIDYYVPFLMHFLAHGVLFEFYLMDDEEDEREILFTKEVVLPAIEKIKEEFGIKPLIVQLYPEHQSEEEDFYWWSYPPHLNDILLEYTKKNNIDIIEKNVTKD